MKTATRDQIRDRRGKAKIRQDLTRRNRRQVREDLRTGREPLRTRQSLERVLT